MGKISRDTFQLNQAKQYVGVRLQSSVPIVDADWNELEDIRKHEHQTFLQAFVGNGVQPGSENFQIQALTLILTAAVNLEIDLVKSTAAAALGFDATNQQATAKDNVPAQLISHHAEPFTLSSGMTLVVKVNGVEQTITFNFPDDAQDQAKPLNQAKQLTTAAVITAINSTVPQLAAKQLTTAAVITAINSTVPQLATTNDFRILGGTPQQPGLCLVEGWEIQIPASLNYTEQLLYNNAELATQWQVTPLFPLTTPTAARSDIIYLDAWERLVDSTEDPDLINDLIGVETCLRRKREWVVRVAEGSESLPESPLGHVYYPLARLTRPANQAAISAEQLTDLRQELALARQSEVQQVAQDVQQVVRDAFNYDYTLAQDGQPHLKISLREAINALLRGGLPSTSVTTLTTAINWFREGCSLEPLTTIQDYQGDIWFFWQQRWDGSWYKRYSHQNNQWGPDTQIATASWSMQIVEGNNKTIWVFSISYQDNQSYLKGKRYLDGNWSPEQTIVSSNNGIEHYSVTDDQNGNLWVFWQVEETDNQFPVRYKRYQYINETWTSPEEVKSSNNQGKSFNKRLNSLTARSDYDGNIWLFWQSYENDNFDIWYKHYSRTSQNWEDERQLTYNLGDDYLQFVFRDKSGNLWVFWQSYQEEQWATWYQYYHPLNGWSWETKLEDIIDGTLSVIGDHQGDLWVFWNTWQAFWYKRYSLISGWGHPVQLTPLPGYVQICYPPTALEDDEGDIWVFWSFLEDWFIEKVQYQKLIPVI
jgi:hypothetical protein